MVEVAQAAAQPQHVPQRALPASGRAPQGQEGHRRPSQARHILESIYHILRDADEYDDHGSDYYLRRNRVSIERRAIRQLEGLGYKVTLEQPPAA